MNGSITGGSATITPTIITGVSEESRGGTQVHPILGRSDPDVTLRVADIRTGQMSLGFANSTAETASAAAVSVLREAAVFTLNAPNRGTLRLAFVVPDSGQIKRELDPETLNAWTVVVDYQEVRT